MLQYQSLYTVLASINWEAMYQKYWLILRCHMFPCSFCANFNALKNFCVIILIVLLYLDSRIYEYQNSVGNLQQKPPM